MKSSTRVLAIDYGTKRIGLAISDEMRMLARPIGIINQSPGAVNELLALVVKESVGLVLLGLPLSLSGEDSDMTRQVRSFGNKLFTLLDENSVEHSFHDERLTSYVAAENLRERGLSKAKRQQRYRYDEEAARIILQEYLDANWGRNDGG